MALDRKRLQDTLDKAFDDQVVNLFAALWANVAGGEAMAVCVSRFSGGFKLVLECHAKASAAIEQIEIGGV